ncbi:amine dehydrogenase large subunit [Novosphingobium terrae]|uniref:amine dehydrogenase large subunit n=1 Tax=Novosphingobium terrae TaxID=2726189 RepID=UPI001F14335A|nr:amine dehydrogenase large subunit [Novosphingobium terrae]
MAALLLGAACVLPAAAHAATAPAPLAEEPIPAVTTLPQNWPASWLLVHDLNFASIIDGKLAIVDTHDTVQPLKGLVRASQFASSQISPANHEIYTAETFYTRLTRGERTDAITIWDMATLQPKGEIVLPGGKRQLSVTYRNIFQLINHDSWALVANFTPAQSVTVVDLAGRKLLGEIDLPGCSHIYPTGERGFTSFCQDGSLISIQLDAAGKVQSSKTLTNVQDIDRQPHFQIPAMIGKVAWFVSYHGQLKGFDLSGPVAVPLPRLANVGTAEGGAPEWRPGGWQVIASDGTSDGKGLLYVLMSPNGKEGSHKDGGTEVWVVDPVAGKRVSRIALGGVFSSIAMTHEAQPRLVAASADGLIDIFDPATGQKVHSLGRTTAANPTLLTPVP